MKKVDKPINDSDFALLADSLPDFIARYGLDGTVLYLNKKLVKSLGYPLEEMLGTITSKVFTDGRFDEFEKKILLCAKTGNEDSLDMTVPNFGGRTEHHHIRIVPERDFEGQIVGVIAFGRDMTERFELEERLVSASRMASLGEMAGGVAHEINNPLAIIKGKCFQLMQLPQRGLFSEEKVLKIVGEIDLTVARIEKVVRGLRSFSRDASADPFKHEVLQTIIIDSLAICEQSIRNCGVDIIHDFQTAEVISINCRAAQISQIIVNLLSNAKDALVNTENPSIRIGIKIEESRVCLVIEDNGPGVPKELRAKIMQPFFTTKPAGVGTGLGLSISKSIALAHEGDLILDPTAAQTRFILSLPKIK